MIKILILEDEKGTCNQLEGFFKYRGFTVFGATNGQDALSIIKKEKPQILILDIKMEGINGLDVLKKAKKGNPNVKAIMITAMDDPVTKARAIELGANEFMTKPFSYDKLENCIIHLVNEVLKLEEAKKK